MKLPLKSWFAPRGKRVRDVLVDEGGSPAIDSLTLAEYVERLGAAMRSGR